MMKSLLSAFTIVLLLVSSTSTAQWQPNHNFGSIICVVHFLDEVGAPNVGFVGLKDGTLWRTTDYGATWNSCQVPGSLNSISTLTFKDAQNGWMGVYAFGSGSEGLFQTTDGGQTWFACSHTGEVTSLCYSTTSKTLFGTLSAASYSTDDGASWKTISDDLYTCIEFASPRSGIFSNFVGGRGQMYYVTHDGGTTWSSVPMPNETWQPASVHGTNKYYVMSEYTSKFFASTDGGDSWHLRYQFPIHFRTGPDGCTRTDNCGSIFFQTVENGFYRSTDSGFSWQPIGGPSNDIDTRWTIANGSIWAGDTSGSLMTYPLTSGPATVVLPATDYFISKYSCVAADTSIPIEFAGCTSSSVTLDSAWVEGSGEIRISDTRTQPRPMSPIDSIVVQYSTTSARRDTAWLHLRYSLNGSKQDTVVRIVGYSPVAPIVKLYRELASSYFGRPDSLPLAVQFDVSQAIDSLWPYIQKISLTYSWDPTIVSHVTYLPPPGWALSSMVPNGNSVDCSIQNLSSLPSDPVILGTAVFMPQTATLSASNVILNSLSITVGGRHVEECIIRNEDQHWAVKVLGKADVDRTVASSPFSIYPNPASGSLCIRSTSDAVASITILDMLGRVVISTTVQSDALAVLSLDHIVAGSYTVICHSNNRTFTSRINIIR